MLPLVGRLIWCLLAPAALAALRLDAAAQDLPDPWRPRTAPLFGASYSPGIGVLLGVGVVHARYGFRALPASTRLLVEAAYATGAGRYRADIAGEFRRPLFPAILNIELVASGIEGIRFYGFGNETGGAQPDSVYRVRQTQLVLAPAVAVPVMPRLRLIGGPLVKYTRTQSDPGTVLAITGPYYGSGGFGGVGARTTLELDTRDQPAAAAHGAHLTLTGEWYPAVWDVAHPFGSLAAEASSYASVGEPAAATLALRVAGAHVGGTVPFPSMVSIGGETTVRGYAEQRFAGPTGAYTNAEVRLLVARLAVGDVGVFGLADGGRVWVAGESSSRWHGAAGGGLWLAWQHRRANTVTIAVARSPERTALYVRAGFLY